MSPQKTYTTKIVYIALIAVLALVLWNLGRPSTVRHTDEGVETVIGGVLAGIRDEAKLTEAQLGEIDPASSTLKLATLGLRGVAISLLWHQSQQYEKKKDWNNVIVASNQIIQLEPHFVSVWEFLGWRLAYNASSEFDDYRERYRWVIRGFDFIVDGTERNLRSPLLRSKAGWTISQRIGIADEKVQFRRLLREDEEFHKRYPDDTPTIADRDNWRIGRNWYQRGEALATKGATIGKESEQLFFQNSRKNLMYYADWLALDGKFGEDGKGEDIKKNWIVAQEEWKKYGQMDFNTAIPKNDPNNPDAMWYTTFAKAAECKEQEDKLTEELLNLKPGFYENLVLENWNRLLEQSNGEEAQASLVDWVAYSSDKDAEIIRKHLDETRPDWKESFNKSKEQIFRKALKDDAALMDMPSLLLASRETMIMENARSIVSQMVSQNLSTVRVTPIMLAERIEDPERRRALAIREELQQLTEERRKSELFHSIINYPYWERYVVVEQQDERIQGRRCLFLARKEFADGAQKEADQIWLEAMQHWEDLLNKPGFEDLRGDEQFLRDFVDLANRYTRILDAEELLFPEKFPLQDLLYDELVKKHDLKKTTDALEYAKKTYEQGDYEKTLEYLQIITRSYASMNVNLEFMKLAPLPVVRDQILEASALYVNCLRKLSPDPDLTLDYDVRAYVNMILKNDSKQQQAVSLLNEAGGLLNSEKYPEAQAKYDEALELWKTLLERYPMIYIDRSSIYFGILAGAAQDYQRVLELQGKTLPDDFLLKPFR